MADENEVLDPPDEVPEPIVFDKDEEIGVASQEQDPDDDVTDDEDAEADL